MNQVPEKLINFRVYEDGTDLVGTADIELPELEYMTDKIKGAGIAGEVDSPVLGHFGSMTVKINWRTLSKPLITLATPKAHNLDFRGAIQIYDAGAGQYKVTPVKVTAKCTPKKTALGKFDVGSSTDSSSELEALYLKVDIDGRTVAEIDKLNYICIIDGVDYLKDIRTALGIE
ncbi:MULTISPECIES: phage major tail tube protein [Caloramator]|uniref:Phage major tail tube protein n=1 Tax=Caloramator australicus RC3 TaxID=857293 RepID=I7J4Q8_9CLOT|nr:MULTISPECIES: phage major tail tube protein [Caloramator]MDO6355280.1 phage major tail tube protein [Caloramator sp. CAR-1]CCJ32891.1 phage major tail tube protein [Caloramator australicus RC3]